MIFVPGSSERKSEMKAGQFIKKVTDVSLYLIVIYYLLPFRPMYLYYSAHHSSADILNELKKENASQLRNDLTVNKEFNQNKDTFPKKDQIRCFFKSGFIVSSPQSNDFVLFAIDQIQTFLHPCYQPALLHFDLNRGPPLA